MAKRKLDEVEQDIAELTMDLQRTRADFENYRKRIDDEKKQSRSSGEMSVIIKLLPIIDTLSRATSTVPTDLLDNAWAQGIAGLSKQIEKMMVDLQVKHIDASEGTHFNPELHQAVQFDDEAEGDHEVVAEELQAGYIYQGRVLRPAMVKVTKK